MVHGQDGHEEDECIKHYTNRIAERLTDSIRSGQSEVFCLVARTDIQHLILHHLSAEIQKKMWRSLPVDLLKEPLPHIIQRLLA